MEALPNGAGAPPGARPGTDGGQAKLDPSDGGFAVGAPWPGP
jgi:hypothetical protein